MLSIEYVIVIAKDVLASPDLLTWISLFSPIESGQVNPTCPSGQNIFIDPLDPSLIISVDPPTTITSYITICLPEPGADTKVFDDPAACITEFADSGNPVDLNDIFNSFPRLWTTHHAFDFF